ncbi:MAG: sulfite exporter TauE/SafE family protein [Proteobacteria bacterium]|nr:sulfite exporter TauE/SafE family protein [Pseudomonadota bacterium]
MLDLWSVAVATCGLFLAGMLKGATGLGYASCALPFLVTAIGLKPAMALVVIPAMSTNIGVAASTAHFAESLRGFARLYIAIVPGVLTGIWLLLWIDQKVAVHVLGIAILAYVTVALAKPGFSLPPRWQGVLQIPTGFANGVLSGLTGSQVIPLFPYMMSLHLPAERFVQSVNLAVLVTSLMLTVTLLFSGIMSWSMLLLSVAAVGPALLGVALGIRARSKISQRQFRTVVLAVLGALGILLLR